MTNLHIGADPFPPYQYYDEDGNLKGFDYERINSIVKSMGYDPIYSVENWPLIEKSFDAKQLDMIFQVQKTEERADKWVFSHKFRDAVTTFVTASSTMTVSSVSDFPDKGLSFGVIQGYQYGDMIDTVDASVKVPCQSLTDILDCILAGTISYGVADKGVFEYLQKKNPQYRGLQIVEQLNFNRPLYVAFHDQRLRDQFNSYL